MNGDLDKYLVDKFDIAEAYWLSPKGEIYPIKGNSKHIDMVFDKPERFNLTMYKIREVYDKYNERYRLEGQAREELFIGIISSGWIRIRDHGNIGWSVQSRDVGRNIKEAIWKWVANILHYSKVSNEKKVFEHDEINFSFVNSILYKNDESTQNISFTFGDVIKGSLEELKQEKE